MIIFKTRRTFSVLTGYLIISLLFCATPLFAQEPADAQLFLAGFNSYQQKEYSAAATQLTELLGKYPDSSLRDMTLFWLARSHYKLGNRAEAGRYMAQFSKEYPDNPLKNTIEEELLALASQNSVVAAADQKQIAAEKGEAERKAEAARQAALKQEEERKAAAELERIAKEKQAEEQRRLEAERLAAARQAEEQRKAAAAEQLAKVKRDEQLKAAAEAERLAKANAAAELKRAEQQAKVAAAKRAEEERLAEAERVAAAARKAAEERRMAAQAEQAARDKEAADRLAAAKVAEEKRSAELAAKRAREQEQALIRKQEAEKSAALQQQRLQQQMKEKAVAEYRQIITRFPDSAAARTASQRLKELGISPPTVAGATAKGSAGVRVAESAVAAKPQELLENSGISQTLTLEAAQYAAFDFTLQPPQTAVKVATRSSIPFEIRNNGNGQDSFYLVSGFPAEFQSRFASISQPDITINQTPPLMPGEKFRGLLLLQTPADSIDGLKIVHPVKAASQFIPEISQSRVVPLTASAPLLRAIVKTDKTQLAPGDTARYNITLLNLGSATAEDLTMRLNFPPQYSSAKGANDQFRQELGAALAVDGLILKPGESREFNALFQLKQEAAAKEELVVRVDLVNNQLQNRGTFLSNITSVLPYSDITLKIASDRLKAIPGQTVSLPVRLLNKGNQREKFTLSPLQSAFEKVVIYNDLNRDGLRQPGEPELTSIGPLAPQEEAALLLEITTSRTAADGSFDQLQLTASPETGAGKSAVATAEVGYTRPVLQMAMKGRQGKMIPGELLAIEFDILNNGSSLAKQVELNVDWPSELELVTADLPPSKPSANGATWRFDEFGAGERRVVKSTFRIKTGTSVGTGVQLKSVLTYQDQIGNRY